MENLNWDATWNIAVDFLKQKQYENFNNKIIELFSLVNCFGCLKEKIKRDVQDLVSILDSIPDNNTHINNLSKGFVHLIVGQEERAYHYLTRSINTNPPFYLSYALRANISKEININFKRDALKAVLLNPSPGNYFTLGRVSANNTMNKSILNFRKAVTLDPDFTCAYNKLGIIYKDLKDYKNAYWNFRRSVALNPNSWNLKMLFKTLYKAGEFGEALKVAIVANKKYPGKKRFLLFIGRAYLKTEDYQNAKHFFESYLSNKIPNRKIEIEFENVQRLFNKHIINQSKAKLKDNDIDGSLSLIVEHLTYENLFGEDINFFFIALLKYFRSGNDINDQNPIYIRLKKLSEVCSNKYDKDEEPTIEEESAFKLVNNLSGYSSDTKIGFGVHRGKTINEIIEENPDHILWCIISLDHFFIPQNLFLNPKLKEQAKYLEALEVNLIKNLLTEEWETNYRNANYSSNIYHNSDYERPQSYGDWLNSEFGEDASTAYWNID